MQYTIHNSGLSGFNIFKKNKFTPHDEGRPHSIAYTVAQEANN